MLAADDPIGPAFDTMTLSRPTARKLVGCWMGSAGTRTLVLPEVWRELTYEPEPARAFGSTQAWQAAAQHPEAPYRWVRLTAEENERAREIRSKFTQACFPQVPHDGIMTHGDAVIVSQALALRTDALVTSDIRSIDHYEINNLIERWWGANAGFVMTLDDALCQAHAGGEGGEQLLVLALATIAPPSNADWRVDAAFADLQALRRALRGAALATVADHIENRWECGRDLERLVEAARALAARSPTLRFERMRAQWHREGRVDGFADAPAAHSDGP